MRHHTVFVFLLAAGFTASSCANGGEESRFKRDGKSLFYNFGGCSTCHRVNADKLVGPGLAGVSKIHSDAWLKKWLKFPEKTWEENDPETAEMRARLGEGKKSKPGMKLVREFSDEEIDALVDFMKTL
jgi:mono/diheme cytochrome c family protein